MGRECLFCCTSPSNISLRSCPLPIIPLCLSREEGVIFFPLSSSALENKTRKKKTPDRRLLKYQPSVSLSDTHNVYLYLYCKAPDAHIIKMKCAQ